MPALFEVISDHGTQPVGLVAEDGIEQQIKSLPHSAYLSVEVHIKAYHDTLDGIILACLHP